MLKLALLSTKPLAFPPRESAARPSRNYFFNRTLQPWWLLAEKITKQLPPGQSLCLAHTATIWEGTTMTGTVRRSARIAAIPSAGRDYLPAQREIIAVCCGALRSGSKVHVPWRGKQGSLLHIKLATFVRYTHMVYRFSLGKQGGIWLCQDNESGRYCFGYHTWGYLLGRVANEVHIRNILEWVATQGY